MAQVFKYVRRDTGPQIQVTLERENTGQLLDLTGATVTLHFRALGDENVMFSRAMFVDPARAEFGEATLQWAEGDLDVDAGVYEGEIEVVSETGMRETMYDRLKFRVRDDFA